MGVAAGAQVHEVAFVKCGGDREKAKQEYEYHGLNDQYYGQHDAGRRTESLFLWMPWRRKLCSGMSI